MKKPRLRDYLFTPFDIIFPIAVAVNLYDGTWANALVVVVLVCAHVTVFWARWRWYRDAVESYESWVQLQNTMVAAFPQHYETEEGDDAKT